MMRLKVRLNRQDARVAKRRKGFKRKKGFRRKKGI